MLPKLPTSPRAKANPRIKRKRGNKYTTLEPEDVKTEMGVVHTTAKTVSGTMRNFLEKGKEQAKAADEPKTVVPPSTKTHPREAR